eukprot:10910921-Lingulodinium_polyedra.AAC.1
MWRRARVWAGLRRHGRREFAPLFAPGVVVPLAGGHGLATLPAGRDYADDEDDGRTIAGYEADGC